MALLEVKDLHTFFRTKKGIVKAVNGVSYSVEAGRTIVINGQEAGGGSIRIHSRDIQKKMFNILGFSDEDIQRKFGFFVDAFNYGAPPHGGLAFGLDRLVMLLCKDDSIRDVIAFPKVQTASCLMSDAPSKVDQKQLDELEISVKE